jgi:hypothetical protein
MNLCTAGVTAQSGEKFINQHTQTDRVYVDSLEIQDIVPTKTGGGFTMKKIAAKSVLLFGGVALCWPIEGCKDSNKSNDRKTMPASVSSLSASFYCNTSFTRTNPSYLAPQV